jgi:SAM-dependent methyltransferase
MSWEAAGHHWGRRAWDWAIYQEPIADNLYEAVLTALDVRRGVRLLDIACGSGLAVQRAVARGAEGTGADASQGLLDIAAQRSPEATWLYAGMTDLPVADGTFDVVTSFNGLQFGGPDAVREAVRVLRPGGRLGVGFWQDPGDFGPLFAALARLAPPPPGAPSPMGFAEPGVVEGALADAGLEVVSRDAVVCVGLYRSREHALLGFGSSGPAVAAEERVGPESVRGALDAELDRHVDRETGVVRLTGLMSWVVAGYPGR